MRGGALLAVGLVIGAMAAYAAVPGVVAQSTSGGNFQFYPTGGASGGPYGFLLDTRTGGLKFCNVVSGQGVRPSTSQCIDTDNSGR